MTGVTKAWERYQKIRDINTVSGLYANTEKAYNFFEDRQWEGIDAGGELPFFNIIKPVIKHKVATVAMNNAEIVYSALNTEPFARQVCDKLNKFAQQQEELLKMETLVWEINKAAAITGDAYLHFFDKNHNRKGRLRKFELGVQQIDNTNIYFADERSSDIQAQKFIIIEERLPVEDVKKIARQNGLKEEDIRLITPDDIDAKDRTETCDYCTALLMYEKKGGEVYFSRSVKNVVFCPEKRIPNLKLYPVVALVWASKKNSARGNGEVLPLIPNQIEINRSLVRRAISVKNTAFPRIAYVENMVENETDLDKVGINIKLKNTAANRINEIISYLTPAMISPDAKALTDELVYLTKELAGAGDSVLGNINPEKASGAAIIAVRDQSLIPMNEQIQRLRQFKEDIALVWYDMITAYNPNGLEFEYQEDGVVYRDRIAASELKKLKVNVRIDVTPINPFNRFAQEQSIQNLFAMGAITFEEYVHALDDTSVMPKVKLMEILESRKTDQLAQAAAVIQDLQAQNAELQQQVQIMPQAIDEAIMKGAQVREEEYRRRREIEELMAIG